MGRPGYKLGGIKTSVSVKFGLLRKNHQSLHQIKMWGSLDEADEVSFHLEVRKVDNQNTGISILVMPSMMTVKDLKKEFCYKVM